MGSKDSKLSQASSRSVQDLQESLSPLGDIRIRKMFGGYGVFEGSTMFALVDSQGGIFFKVDDTNRQLFDDAGSTKHGRMPYHQVPDHVLVEEVALLEWAQTSITIARKAKRRKK
jgi:DNA transformation protein